MADYNAKERKKNATVTVKGKAKFPIGDKSHAVQAIRFENRAKPPLTEAQKEAVERKAAKFGVGLDANGKRLAKKSTKQSVKKEN